MAEAAEVAKVKLGDRRLGADEEGMGRSGTTQAMIAKGWAYPSPRSPLRIETPEVGPTWARPFRSF